MKETAPEDFPLSVTNPYGRTKLILEEKAVYKNHLPADYEELKVEERNRNIESTNTITSLKDLVEKDITDYEVRKNITPEQIEQEVLFKIDVTEEEYNLINNSDDKLKIYKLECTIYFDKKLKAVQDEDL